MKVEYVGQSTIAGEDLDRLASIMMTVKDSWHTWAGPDAEDPRLANYVSAYPNHAEVLNKSTMSANAYGRPIKALKVVPNEEASTQSMTLSVAHRYLRQPLRVLVENVSSDAEFFERAFRAVNPKLVDQLTLVPAPWEFQHCGGKPEALKIAKRLMKAAAKSGVPERIFLLVDSDAAFVGHKEASTLKLEALSVPIWTTAKRAIENYMSDRILDSFSTGPRDDSARRFIKALSSEQRDFFPIRDGLNRPRLADQKALYAGLGTSALASARLPTTMTKFLEDSRSSFTKADLVERSCETEFNEIAASIEREL